jgi:type II secretory pathway component PulF
MILTVLIKIINSLRPPDQASLGDKIKNSLKTFYFSRIAARMTQEEQILFAKRLAILIKSGVPIASALGMMVRQTKSASSKRIIHGLRDSVETGQTLSRAMADHKNSFGNFAINIVAIGEMSGNLAKNLDYLAGELKKYRDLKRNIASALVYPAFILAVTVGIVILLTAYVFPKILPVFSSFSSKLPWSTRTLIVISQAIQHYWANILAALVVAAVVAALLLKIPRVRLAADRFLLGLPLLGPMFKTYHVANFCRTLGMLLASETGIVRALKILQETFENTAYRAVIGQMIEAVTRGESISQNMEKENFLFPALASQMVGVGEITGNLSSGLIYLSEIYEDEMKNMAKNLSTSIEPALMIFMGFMVGFVALSIITPIYGITQNLRQ